MIHRGILASFGVCTTSSVVAYEEWLKTPSIASALAFGASVASAIISYKLAGWAETQRDRRHLERLKALAELVKDSNLTVQDVQDLDDLDGPAKS